MRIVYIPSPRSLLLLLVPPHATDPAVLYGASELLLRKRVRLIEFEYSQVGHPMPIPRKGQNANALRMLHTRARLESSPIERRASWYSECDTTALRLAGGFVESYASQGRALLVGWSRLRMLLGRQHRHPRTCHRPLHRGLRAQCVSQGCPPARLVRGVWYAAAVGESRLRARAERAGCPREVGDLKQLNVPPRERKRGTFEIGRHLA